jgi:hypothetical protein
MTSYPKNVQFTNLKINSDQDLFAINPIAPVNNDDDIMNALCNVSNSCVLPDLDLLPPCNGILAALKVNGSVAICKGINIGNTDVEIKGTIRFNGKNFEGYNCDGWVPLDCCGDDDNNCKIYDIDNELNGSISVGDLVTFSTKSSTHSVHKLLCDKWEWSSRISSLNNEKQPKIAVDKCGKAYVVGYTDSINLPNFYNSDDTVAVNNFSMHNFFNKYIFIGKINSYGCWEYTAIIDSNSDEIDPEITVGCSGSLYITGQCGGSDNMPIFYNYDSSIGLEGLNSQYPETFIAKLNGVGIWLWSAEIQYSSLSNKIQPNLSVDMCDNLYVVNDVLENSIATVYDNDKNSYILPVNAQKQILVALYSGNGSVNWITRVGGTYDQINGNVMVDGFGNAYICGIGNEPIYYDKFDQVEQTGVSEIIDQLWIGKICFTGNWEWNTRITNVDSNYGEIVLSNDIDCNLYIGFIANDYPEFYSVGNSLALSGNNQNSIYIGKISSNGFWYWATNILSSSDKNITSIDVDGNGYIYVSGDSNGDLEFYNIDGSLGEKLFNKNSNKYVWLGRLNAYGYWDWAIQIYGENDNFNPSVSVDSSGNIFLAGESAPTNSNILYLDPPNNILGIEGKGSPTGEIFVGKIVNESQSAKMIGVIKDILEDGKVCIQFDGEIIFKNASFIPGMSYYYDCYSEEIVNYCYKNMRLLRNVGIACDTDSLLWNSTGKFCVNKDKNCNQVITNSDISAQTISGTFIYTTNPGYSIDPKTAYKATKINNVITITIDKFEGDPDVSISNKFKTDIGVLDIIFRPSHEITTIVKVKNNGIETMGTLTVNVDGSICFTNNFGDFTGNNQMIGNCTINYVI